MTITNPGVYIAAAALVAIAITFTLFLLYALVVDRRIWKDER